MPVNIRQLQEIQQILREMTQPAKIECFRNQYRINFETFDVIQHDLLYIKDPEEHLGCIYCHRIGNSYYCKSPLNRYGVQHLLRTS